MQKKLIILIGTGRSGSASLSAFLSAQKNMRILHEGKIEKKNIRKLIKWENDENELFIWLDYLLNYDKKTEYIGDTGMYFLPYIDDIIQRYNNVKIIGLVRNKEEVIDSFIKKTKGRNHWYNHDGKEWQKDEKWDPCFPKYDIKNKRKAIEEYYKNYIKNSNAYEKKYPKKFKTWNIKEFNNTSIKNEILDFINYQNERVINKEFKKNTNIKSQKEYFLKKIKEWFSA